MAVDVFKSVLDRQIARAVSLPTFSYEAEIGAMGRRFKAIAVTSLTERHLYIDNLFEDNLITVAMEPSQYTEMILIGHESLSLKLLQRPYSGMGEVYERTFHAVIVSHQDAKRDGNITDVTGVNALDLTSLSIITFQLITSASFDLRLRELGAIYPNATAVDVLRHYLASVRLEDRLSQKSYVSAVNVEPGASDRVFKSIKIPEGTRFMAFPDYLQKNYGVYGQGLGCFLRGQRWYVFSPFNVVKRDTDTRRLVVFNAPPGSYRELPNNFHLIGNTVTVIATGETKHRRYSDEDALNGGTGVRFASMDSIQGKGSTDNPDEDPTRTPEEYITEYRGVNYNNGNQNTVTVGGRLTDNPLDLASRMAARGGEVVDVMWLHGSLMPLRPGMPVTFYYGDNGQVKNKTGTLITAECMSSIPAGGFVEPEHRTTVRLVLFLKDDEMV